MDEPGPTKPRRRVRRYRRGVKMKRVVLVIGIFCLIAGLVWMPVALVLETSLILPWTYLGASVVLLVWRAILEGMGWLRRRRRRHVGMAPVSARGGFALLLALLLMACLTAIAFQSQVFARLALRQSQAELSRAETRIAAANSAWHAVRSVANARSAGRDATAANPALETIESGPSGFNARASIMETNLSVLPAVLQGAGREGAGRVYAIRAVAGSEAASHEIRAWVWRGGRGDVRLLAWVED